MFNLFNSSGGLDWLLVGLGNVGPKYAGNRHNVGFLFIDDLASEVGPLNWQNKYQGEFTKTEFNGYKVGLLKPGTMMNHSGRSVNAAAKFFKLKPQQVIVAYDELDLPFNKLKTKLGGGDAGHNGLKDITRHLGKEYHRLRFGIGHPGDKAKVIGHVLSDFSKAEQQQLPALFDQAKQTLEKVMKD